MYHYRLLLIISLLIGMECYAQLLNGNFESGRNVGWTESSQGNFTLIAPALNFASTSISPVINPHSGSWIARIGGFAYEVNYITQIFTLPNTKPLYLSFYLQSRTANTSECAGLWVGAKTSIIINNQLISQNYLCQYNDLHQWTQYYVDLSAIAGQSVQVTFAAEAANSVWSFLYLDDISLTNNTSTGLNTATYYVNKFELVSSNPFNDKADFNYQLDESQHVSIKIYDFTGKELETLVNSQLSPGNHTASWNATYYKSGIYFCRMIVNNQSITRKLILLK